MESSYIYYIPVYPDDDRGEVFMHLFSGRTGLDQEILNLLTDLDQREQSGEGVDYIQELENQLQLKRVSVHELHRERKVASINS